MVSWDWLGHSYGLATRRVWSMQRAVVWRWSWALPLVGATDYTVRAMWQRLSVGLITAELNAVARKHGQMLPGFSVTGQW